MTMPVIAFPELQARQAVDIPLAFSLLYMHHMLVPARIQYCNNVTGFC